MYQNLHLHNKMQLHFVYDALDAWNLVKLLSESQTDWTAWTQIRRRVTRRLIRVQVG